MSGISDFCEKYGYTSFGHFLSVSGPATTLKEYYAYKHLEELVADKAEQKDELEEIWKAVDPVAKSMKHKENVRKRKSAIEDARQLSAGLDLEIAELRKQLKAAREAHKQPEEEEATQIVDLDGETVHESQAFSNGDPNDEKTQPAA